MAKSIGEYKDVGPAFTNKAELIIIGLRTSENECFLGMSERIVQKKLSDCIERIV